MAPASIVETGMSMTETNRPELIATNVQPSNKTTMQPGEDVSDDVPIAGSTDSSDTEADCLSQEEQDSIELARQLMAEEAMASYHHHVDSLRVASENGEMSPDAYAIWQVAMQEEEREEAEEEEAANELSYDGLLQLSERIGDVRTERWAMVAAKEIEKLPVSTFDPASLDNATNDSQHKCLVCQCDYEENEQLRILPCSHRFHQPCVDFWLKTKDFCPYCRTSIVS